MRYCIPLWVSRSVVRVRRSAALPETRKTPSESWRTSYWRDSARACGVARGCTSRAPARARLAPASPDARRRHGRRLAVRPFHLRLLLSPAAPARGGGATIRPPPGGSRPGWRGDRPQQGSGPRGSAETGGGDASRFERAGGRASARAPGVHLFAATIWGRAGSSTEYCRSPSLMRSKSCTGHARPRRGVQDVDQGLARSRRRPVAQPQPGAGAGPLDQAGDVRHRQRSRRRSLPTPRYGSRVVKG